MSDARNVRDFVHFRFTEECSLCFVFGELHIHQSDFFGIESMDLYTYPQFIHFFPPAHLAINLTSHNVWYHLQFATTKRDFWIPGHGLPPNLTGDTGIEQTLLPMQAW
jgi:hypothetical protein